MTQAFDHLPAAMRRLVPELADGPGDEGRADCARCPQVALAPSTAAHPWAFHAATRCCTAHPSLPNFLVGGALRRGGASRARVEARLAEPGGVTAWGIDAPPGYDERYGALAGREFGRALELRCPYWVGGVDSCGVWRDRPALCRTWYCKHDDGLRGAIEWSQLGAVLTDVESRLARHCIAIGAPPAAGAADRSAWVAWFEWAAACVDGLDDAALAALAVPDLPTRRTALVSLRVRPRPRLPEVLVAAVSDRADAGDGSDAVLLAGYSSYDAIRAPRTIYVFLALLTGGRRWREALAEARASINAAGGDASGLDEALVAELHRAGVLESPGNENAGAAASPRAACE